MEKISVKDKFITRLLLAAAEDDGMATAEYAIGTMTPIRCVILGCIGRNGQTRWTPPPPHTYPAWTQPEPPESPRSPSR